MLRTNCLILCFKYLLVVKQSLFEKENLVRFELKESSSFIYNILWSESTWLDKLKKTANNKIDEFCYRYPLSLMVHAYFVRIKATKIRDIACARARNRAILHVRRDVFREWRDVHESVRDIKELWVHWKFIKGREIHGLPPTLWIVLPVANLLLSHGYFDCSVNISERRISLRRVNRDMHSYARSIYDTGDLDDVDEMLYQVTYTPPPFCFPEFSTDRKSDNIALCMLVFWHELKDIIVTD